jgi:hypothetical protein
METGTAPGWGIFVLRCDREGLPLTSKGPILSASPAIGVGLNGQRRVVGVMRSDGAGVIWRYEPHR